MNVALPSWATRDGVPALPPLDDGLTLRLLQSAARRELSEDELTAIAAVCARVDEPSDFLRTMIDRWAFKGSGERFMARLFAWLARERDVLWLGDLLRRQKPWTDHVWARIAPRRRALELLVEVNSPLAWLEVLRFRDSTRIDDLYRAARDLAYRQKRPYDLGAPDLGTADGVREFAGLQIVARDRDDVHLLREDGRTFAHAPRAVPQPLREDWKLLRAAIHEVLDRGAHRLERAMVTQHRWDHAQWRRSWFEHGLLAGHARRVVWRGYTDFGVFTFLINEEREVLRYDGSPLDLDAVWAFEVAHPTSFVDEDWQAVLVDHEVVQPFEQVRRGGPRSRGDLDPHALIATERWGWERRARHVGKARDMLVLCTPEHDVRLHIHPGLYASEAGRPKPKQVLQTIIKTEVVVRASGTSVPHAEWPALVELEVELLRARAAI